MSSRHLVDPALTPLLESQSIDLSAADLPATRERSDQMAAWAASIALPDGVIEETRLVGGFETEPDVPVLILQPQSAAELRPAILHIHGGGYVTGSARLYRPLAARLAASIGAVVVSVDYRLAPETPFPGALHDCYAALRWLHHNAASLGVDPTRIAIAGESAGGGLAAALALFARDRDEIAIAFQLLTFPMLDDRTGSTIDRGPMAGEFMWNAVSNRYGWTCLLGREPGADDVSPYAAAARADDLAGLPPTFIAVGALDLFLEENLEYIGRLARAGVPVAARIYPGAVHAFMLIEQADIAQQYRADVEQALKAALRAPAQA